MLIDKDTIMGKIIPFPKSDISKISDDMFAAIEIDLKKSFNVAITRNDGETTIVEAKKEALNVIARKYNITLEKAGEIVREIQLRSLDKDLGIE